MVSDGETAEGVIWEALKFLDTHDVPNIQIYIMSNGYGAYDKVDSAKLTIQSAGSTIRAKSLSITSRLRNSRSFMT